MFIHATHPKHPALRLHADTVSFLICPSCRSALAPAGDGLRCGDRHAFPVVDGVPILIDDATSVFRVSDFVRRDETTFRSGGRLRRLKRYLPRLVATPRDSEAEAGFADLLLAANPAPRVLVIGAGEDAGRSAALKRRPEIELVLSDVHLGRLTDVVADAHRLPFADESFGAVLIHAVLEHLVQPWVAAEEIRRVLTPGGLVWATFPFMRSVHMGAYDFYRASPLAHRLLWDRFDTVHHAPKGGLGMPLATAWHDFLRGFARGKRGAHVAETVARLTAWPLVALDGRTADAPAAWDAARGSTFIGRKRPDDAPPLSVRALLGLYGGLG